MADPLDGVESGANGRRRGKGKPYSPTPIAGYRRSWEHVLKPEFGPMVAEETSEVEWQMWVDQLSREGLSRSRIATPPRSPPRSRVGTDAEPPVRDEKPAADRRTAAQRREAPAARGRWQMKLS